jgi:hypothetical protein
VTQYPSNLYFLPGARELPEEARVPLMEAVRSFGELVSCAELLEAGPLGGAGKVNGRAPIVAFQILLPRVQRRLDELAGINVATWPDTQWVLGLNADRVRADLRLRAVWRCLIRTPPVPGALDDGLAASIGGLADALRKLCLEIVQRYPEALGAA